MEKNNGKIRAGSAYLKTGIISAICITAFTLLVVFLTTILPLILMSLLFILVPSLISSTSFMILPAGALAIFLAWRKFRRSAVEDRA